MVEQKIKGLIEVWYEKGQIERDRFSKFVFFWICFNAWLAYESNKDWDKEMIEWLIGQKSQISKLIKAYKNAQNSPYYLTKLEILAKMSPIYDSRGKPDRTIKIHDKNDFENIVKGIYQIRCNFFHGGKNANESRDQSLVDVSNEILENWIGNLIGEWKKDN